jgi:hypothetical protein
MDQYSLLFKAKCGEAPKNSAADDKAEGAPTETLSAKQRRNQTKFFPGEMEFFNISNRRRSLLRLVADGDPIAP